MKKLILVDDDYSTELLVEALSWRGHSAKRFQSAALALNALDEIESADLVILDIIMERPAELLGSAIGGGTSTGLALMRVFRNRNSTQKILFYSGSTDTATIDLIRGEPNTFYLPKTGMYDRRELLQKVEWILGVTGQDRRQVFVVHGHDETTKMELKNYLQNTLHLPEPIILHEQPNLGRTIIEKFEDLAARADLAFVVLTPDDLAATASDPDNKKRRARQNVIFELGYFLGVFGRRSGQVFLLHKGPLELPSDLLGVIYIDISGGVAAAGEQIRKELEHVH